MANDFTLSGHLLIRGIQGLDIEIPKLRRQLETLKIDSLDSVKKLPQSFDAASAAAKRTGREIAGAATNLQDFGDKAALALRRFTAFSIAAGATFGAAKLIVGGLKEAAVFQRELVKVQQVSGATANSIASLRDEITRLGHALAAPASELVAVSTTLSQAGFKIAEVKSILEDLSRTRLAATFGTLQDTTEGIIAISGQFKIKVSEMGDALGITNAVAAKYAVESEDLISAIRRTGGVFASASSGISQGTQALSEFYALFSSVRQTTRQANETISTGLRTVFARLERPKTVNYFKDLGIDLTDASGKFIGVFNAIQKIGQALDGLDTRSLKFAEIVDAIGGARQLGVVVPLIKEWRLQQEILNTALGGTKSLINDAIAPLDTLVERVNILANDWSAFSRDVFNSKTFQVLAKEAISFASAVVKAADSISSLLPIFAALGAVKLGAAIASEGAVGYVAKRLTTGIGGPNIHKHALGGHIGGVGNGDTVPILATPGEFVIRKGAAEALGPKVLNKLNHADKYAMGGMIGRRLGYEDGGTIFGQSSNGNLKDIFNQFIKEGKELGISFSALNSVIKEITNVLASVAPSLKQNEAVKLTRGALQAARHIPTGDLQGGGASAGVLQIPIQKARASARVDNFIKDSSNRQRALPSPIHDLVVTRSDGSQSRIGDLPDKERAEQIAFAEKHAPKQLLLTKSDTIFGGPPRFRRPYRKPPSQGDKERANSIADQSRSLDTGRALRNFRTVLVNDSLDNLTDPEQIRARALGGYVKGNTSIPSTLNVGRNELGTSLTVQSKAYREDKVEQEKYNLYGRTPETPAEKKDRRFYARNNARLFTGIDRISSGDLGGFKPVIHSLAQGVYTANKEVVKDIASSKYLKLRSTGNFGGDFSERPLYQDINKGISVVGNAGINAAQFVNNKIDSGVRYTGNKISSLYGSTKSGLRGVGRRVADADPLALGLLSAGVQYGGDKFGVDSRITGTLSGALGGAALGSQFGGPYGAAAGAVIGGVTGLANATQEKDLAKVNKDLAASSKDLAKAFDDLSIGSVAKLDAALKHQFELTQQKSDIQNRSFGQKLGNGLAGIDSSSFLPTSLGDTHGRDALDIFNRGFLPKIFNDAGGAIGGGLVGNESDTNKSKSQDLAEANSATAQQARDRIKQLTSRGRGKDITDTLLQASFSDDAKKLQGLAEARSGKGDNGATLRGLIGEARNNLANDADLAKGKGLDVALQNIDTFANQLDKAGNLLGLFSSNLEQSQTAIEAAFNTTQGNFSINKKFQNPFDNIGALSPAQIKQATSDLEGNLGGAKLDTKFKQVLESTSTLTDLPNIISKAQQEAEKSGFDVTDSSKFIGSLLNKQGGPLGNLPGRVKRDLSSVFDNLSPEDAKAYLSGESDNKNAQEINNKVNQITQKSVGVAKKFQDSVNEFGKTFYVDAANQRSTIQSQGTRLGATREDLIGSQTLSIDRLKDKLIDPNKSAALELNPIKALTGGLSDPTQIGNRIRSLQASRATAESGIDPQTGKFFNSQKDQSAAIGSLNSSLTTATEGLNKLATTAIGLAAIEAKLAIVKERENNAANSALSDALGGGQQDRAKGEAALALFNKTGDLRAVAGQGFTQEDLDRGIKNKRDRIALETGDKEKGEQFFRDEARAVNKSYGQITGDPNSAANEQVFKDTDKEKKTLIAQAGIAADNQLKALDEQRKLLADNLKSFDDTITSKFLVGVTQLAAVAKQLSIPESISVKVLHEFGPLNVTGLDLAGLTPAMQKIAQDAVGLALSKLTDGQNKGSTPIPGNIRSAVDEGFGG